MEPPGAVFEPAAADFAARSLFSDVGVSQGLAGLFPAAEIADEVYGGDDRACRILGDSTSDVVLPARW